MQCRLGIQDILALKKGDTFFEARKGMEVEMQIVTPAFLENGKCRWVARHARTASKQAYLITLGAEQYGPKLYRASLTKTVDRISKQNDAKDRYSSFRIARDLD